RSFLRIVSRMSIIALSTDSMSLILSCTCAHRRSLVDLVGVVLVLVPLLLEGGLEGSEVVRAEHQSAYFIIPQGDKYLRPCLSPAGSLVASVVGVQQAFIILSMWILIVIIVIPGAVVVPVRSLHLGHDPITPPLWSANPGWRGRRL